MTRPFAFAWIIIGCGGGTPPPVTGQTGQALEADGPAFTPGEAVAYHIKDGAGRVLGRVHSRYDQKDGSSTVVTRVAIGAPVGANEQLVPSRTYEYATTLAGDLRPVSFKRISSIDGRMTLAFEPTLVSRVTDVGSDQLPITKADASLVPKEDLVLLALAIERSGLSPGQSGRLPIRTPDVLEPDDWLVQVFADAARKTIVQLPSGKAVLTSRGQVFEFTSRSGWVFERLPEAGDPPSLLPVPERREYVRPSNASWVDKEIVIPVEGGQLAGVLSEPRYRSKWKKNIVPGIVFLSDLALTNRHGFTGTADYGTWQIFDSLVEQGFAVLRLDERGVGASKSSIPPEAVTVETRLADAMAMVETMKRQPTVDPEKILVIGHGWGAVDALLLAKALPLTGVVLLGAPSRPAADVLGERAAAILGTDPTGGRVDMRKVVDVLGGKPAGDEPFAEAILELYRPFAKRVVGYALLDVKVLAKDVEEPVAVFQGFKDFEVSWKDDAKPLFETFDKKRAKLFVYEFVDHLMKQESGRSDASRYKDGGRKVDRDVLKDLDAWMTEKALSS
jgi:pimeloyl-ACP methyl ester carboxylesterase